MGVEIERKFLVNREEFIAEILGEQHRCYQISQYYLNESTRIRREVHSNGERKYYMTTKQKSSELSRIEVNVEIPVDLGEELFNSFVSVPGADGLGHISKTRYLTSFLPGQKIDKPVAWEVDVFHNRNEGLIIAEIELQEDESFVVGMPPMVGEEITGDPRYYNAHLAQYPYKEWKNEGRQE